MFNIGPLELMVLAIVGLVVLGPDRLPGFARDAARLLRSLRDMATGARQQLKDELGPEFADLDLRNLNPKTAVTRAVFGDDLPDLSKFDPRRFDARTAANDFLRGGDGASANGSSANGASVNGSSVNGSPVNGSSVNGSSANGSSLNGRVSMSKSPEQGTTPPARPRPRPRPGGSAPGPASHRYDDTT